MRRKLKLFSISALAAVICVTFLALTGVAAEVTPTPSLPVNVLFATGLRPFVFAMFILYVLAIWGELRALGSSKPWPRTRSKTASESVWSLLIAAGLVAWAASLLF